jgi:hypothetical protein
MDQFFTLMEARYGGAWTHLYGGSAGAERVHKATWQAEFARHGLTWRQVQEIMHRANSETLPWPTLAGFMGLAAREADSREAYLSFRPAEEVLLPPPVRTARGEAKGRAALAGMRALFDVTEYRQSDTKSAQDKK